MAIIAQDKITLICVVDVEAIITYYKLQSSTLAKPSAPTTNPPSGWTDTEPTYTEGSTNSLYYCQLVKFSDGTWNYSNVSLSSSYEASKIAYNKAQNAQDTANSANDKANSNSDRIDETNSALNNTTVTITESYTSLINQTKKQLELLISQVSETATTNSNSITSINNSINLTAEDIALVKTTTQLLEDLVNGKVDESTIREWARFDGAQLELGMSNSEFKTILSTTELGFYQGNEKVAWISNQELHVLRAIITKSLGVGRLRIVDETETLGVYSILVI